MQRPGQNRLPWKGSGGLGRCFDIQGAGSRSREAVLFHSRGRKVGAGRGRTLNVTLWKPARVAEKRTKVPHLGRP